MYLLHVFIKMSYFETAQTLKTNYLAFKNNFQISKEILLTYVTLTKEADWRRHFLFFTDNSGNRVLVCKSHISHVTQSMFIPIIFSKGCSWCKFQLHTISQTWDTTDCTIILYKIYIKKKVYTRRTNTSIITFLRQKCLIKCLLHRLLQID